ncbi:hypothetical protein LCGC14_1176290 [marine sediment metagenome]|uniref:Uncharacterized protein n=1 Tax=marine sediment metagenome TaxID=412755 RepID=A0A0F9LT90_9ZZZZ
MATHRISILGSSLVPDLSGNAYPDAYPAYATNDTWKHLVLVHEDSGTRTGFYGTFAVPQNYVSGANLVLVWTSTATAGDVEWDYDYRAVGGNDAESLDQAAAQESVNAADTAPSATDERMEITIALTDGNFAPGDTVEFFLARDGTDGGDTLAASVLIFEAFFEYADA